MFDSITGTLVRLDPGEIVISNRGIAYRLSAPQRTLRSLPEEGEITLYTHLSVKDDAFKLYGFQTPFERDLFLKILGVSGVGAAIALSLLSEIPPAKLMEALATEDFAFLQRIKGVGARTARRLVLELKDKLDWSGVPGTEADATAVPGGQFAKDLMDALQALGFTRSAARDGAAKVLAEHPDSDDLESLIKSALRTL